MSARASARSHDSFIDRLAIVMAWVSEPLIVLVKACMQAPPSESRGPPPDGVLLVEHVDADDNAMLCLPTTDATPSSHTCRRAARDTTSWKSKPRPDGQELSAAGPKTWLSVTPPFNAWSSAMLDA